MTQSSLKFVPYGTNLPASVAIDLKEVFRQLRQQQASSTRKYVRYPARRIVPTENEQAFEADSTSGG